jgi:outer membrane protein W
MKDISLFKLSIAVSMLFLLSSSSLVRAQEENKLYFGIGYNITQPLNNTFTDQTGLYGGHVEAEYYINKTYSVGFNTSWNTLLKYIPTKTYPLLYEAGDITTDMYNSVYNMAYTLFGRYHFKQNERFKPFLSLAMGAQNTEFTEFYSIYQDRQTAWGFIVRPEIGTVISISKNNKTNLIAGLDYFYSTNSNKSLNINNIQGVEFNIGIQFNLERRY